MSLVDTSTDLGEWVMPNLMYQEATISLGFSEMYQQDINRLKPLKPFPLEEDK